MIVVDTSVLVGYFLSSDTFHRESVAWYDAWTLRDASLQMPLLGLVELAGTLGRQGVERTIVGDTIAEILGRNRYQLHELDLYAAQFAAGVAASAGLKGADAVFVALAAQLGIPLVSWDQQQRERGALFCRTMTPVEAMEMAE